MPAAFAAALLNSQPMGFYAPAQIVRDARDHGVNILHPDVNYIGWDCDLEWQSDGKAALRLGLRQIKGLRRQDAIQIEKNKRDGYTHPGELISRAGVRSSTLELLARGDAFQSMGLSRRQAFWIVRGIANSTFDSLATKDRGLPLFSNAKEYHRNTTSNIEPKVLLPIASIGEEVVDDYNVLRLSLKSHPLTLLRKNLLGNLYKPIAIFGSLSDGSPVCVAGLVLVRQRPSTAKGIIFITIEDETGIANLIVWSRQFERFRHIIMNAKLLGVTGKLQREGEVIHIIVEALEDLTHKLNELSNSSFKEPIAYADELKILNNSSETPESSQAGKKKTLGVKSRDFH
jgi:error-prone DNA polymerase